MNIMNTIKEIINPVQETKPQSNYYTFDHPFMKVNQYGRHDVFTFEVPDKRYSKDGGWYETTRQKHAWYDEADYEELLKDVVSSKESYLQWVKEWRDCYKFVSKEIRYAKANRKKDHPDKSREQWQWIGRMNYGGITARRLMIMRNVAKTMSWEKRMATFLKDKEVIEI